MIRNTILMALAFLAWLTIDALQPATAADFMVGADCTISWPARPPAEAVTAYRVYIDNRAAITTDQTVAQCPADLGEGEHQVTVAAVNFVGEGAKAVPVTFFIVAGVPGQVGAVRVAMPGGPGE